MIYLYVETNFLIGHAKFQDDASPLQSIIVAKPQELSIIIPSICIMETLSVLEDEKKRNSSFDDKINQSMKQIFSAQLSTEASVAKGHYNNILVQSVALFSKIETRIYDILKWTILNAEVIPFSNHAAINSFNVRYIEEPTDNLILHTILDHANTNVSKVGQKVLLSNNSRDFGKPPAKTQLDNTGIKYLRAHLKSMS